MFVGGKRCWMMMDDNGFAQIIATKPPVGQGTPKKIDQFRCRKYRKICPDIDQWQYRNCAKSAKSILFTCCWWLIYYRIAYMLDDDGGWRMDGGWWMMMLPFGWFESPLTRMVVISLPLPPSGLVVDLVLFLSCFCWLCTMVNHPKKGTIWGIYVWMFVPNTFTAKGKKWVPWESTIAVLLKTLPHFALYNHYWLVVSNILLIFTPTWGNDPIWRAYFSSGLVQPPTR